MTIPEFLAWQWSDYPAKHRDRVNLAIHIVAVPLFMLGCAVVAFGILRLAPMKIVTGLVAMLVSVVLEGIGHRLEAEQPAPFNGVADFWQVDLRNPRRTPPSRFAADLFYR